MGSGIKYKILASLPGVSTPVQNRIRKLFTSPEFINVKKLMSDTEVEDMKKYGYSPATQRQLGLNSHLRRVLLFAESQSRIVDTEALELGTELEEKLKNLRTDNAIKDSKLLRADRLLKEKDKEITILNDRIDFLENEIGTNLRSFQELEPGIAKNILELGKLKVLKKTADGKVFSLSSKIAEENNRKLILSTKEESDENKKDKADLELSVKNQTEDLTKEQKIVKELKEKIEKLEDANRKMAKARKKKEKDALKQIELYVKTIDLLMKKYMDNQKINKALKKQYSGKVEEFIKLVPSKGEDITLNLKAIIAKIAELQKLRKLLESKKETIVKDDKLEVEEKKGEEEKKVETSEKKETIVKDDMLKGEEKKGEEDDEDFARSFLSGLKNSDQ